MAVVPPPAPSPRTQRAVAIAAGLATAIAIWLTIDVHQAGPLSRGDAGRLRPFVDHRPELLVDVARAVTSFGGYRFLLVVGVLVAAALRWRGVPLRVAATPLITVALTDRIISPMKSWMDRARPPEATRLAEVTDRSFPSGHAGYSTALYLTVAAVVALTLVTRPRHRRLVVAGTAVWCGLIGLTRLLLGVHWPTDVLAGWCVGFVAAALAAASVVRFPGAQGRPDG